MGVLRWIRSAFARSDTRVYLCLGAGPAVGGGFIALAGAAYLLPHFNRDLAVMFQILG